MNSTPARYRLRIRGRVQGVGFRFSVSMEARRLGLAGWVSNEADGSVTVVVEGSSEGLETLRRHCAAGFSAARVDSVTLAEEPAEGLLPQPFEIRL